MSQFCKSNFSVLWNILSCFLRNIVCVTWFIDQVPDIICRISSDFHSWERSATNHWCCNGKQIYHPFTNTYITFLYYSRYIVYLQTDCGEFTFCAVGGYIRNWGEMIPRWKCRRQVLFEKFARFTPRDLPNYLTCSYILKQKMLWNRLSPSWQSCQKNI